MAVVNKRAASLPDLNAAKSGTAPVALDHGRMRTTRHQADVANGDSATSTFEIARLPSHARISPLSILRSPGIGGLTNVDVGFADAPDALVDGANLTTATTVGLMSNVALGDDKKALWELAGLTADPKAKISVFITLNTNATAAGTLVPEFVYIVD